MAYGIFVEMKSPMSTCTLNRHHLYELNYAGNHENIRLEVLLNALSNGQAEAFKGFAEQCMTEYDLDGWTAPDLITPDDINLHMQRFKKHEQA